jgi:hypothetical protein
MSVSRGTGLATLTLEGAAMAADFPPSPVHEGFGCIFGRVAAWMGSLLVGEQVVAQPAQLTRVSAPHWNGGLDSDFLSSFRELAELFFWQFWQS